MSIACAHCREHFNPTKPWARYCTAQCRIKAHRAKHRTVAVTGLQEAETALVNALAAVRAGDAPAGREAARRALVSLGHEGDPLLDAVERAVADGHSAASIARGSGLGSATTISQWRRGERIGPKTREKVAGWLASNGYGANASPVGL